MALTIDKMKTAFLSMDFQNILMHENGKNAGMGILAHAKKTNCLANTRKAIEASRHAEIPVIHVILAFREGYPEISDKARPQFKSMKEMGILLEGSWDAQIHEEVKPQPGEIIVTKRRMNCFYGTDLEAILHAKGITTLVLSGVATNFAVESAARYAHDADYQVVVLEDCCATVNDEMQSFSINVLAGVATISNSEEYIQATKG